MKMFRLFPRFRRAARDESGSATVEFTIYATSMLMSFFWVFDNSLVMTKKMMLERAVDITVRELRLAISPTYTHDYLKARICAHATSVFRDCEANILLEMSPVDLSVGFVRSAQCIDRVNDVTPLTQWDQGSEGEVVYIRACILVDTILPPVFALFPNRSESGIPLFADTAYVNEPA